MINLNALSEVLRAVLDGAHTTTAPDFHVSWDENDDSGETFGFGNQDGVLNGTTPVDIMDDPSGASVQKNAKQITIFNRDTVNAVVTVSFYDGSNTRHLYRATLEPNWTLAYESCSGWTVYDDDGIQQGSGGGGGGGTFLKHEAGRKVPGDFSSSGSPSRQRAAVTFTNSYTNPRVTLAWDEATKRVFTFESLTGSGMTLVSSSNSTIPGGSVHYHVIEEGASS